MSNTLENLLIIGTLVVIFAVIEVVLGRVFHLGFKPVEQMCRQLPRRIQITLVAGLPTVYWSANGAVPYQPGATPQVSGDSENRGPKARSILSLDLDRAFSAPALIPAFTWGVAPGWYGTTPLALSNRSRLPSASSVSRSYNSGIAGKRPARVRIPPVTLRTNDQHRGNRAFPSTASIPSEAPPPLSGSPPEQQKRAGFRGNCFAITAACVAGLSAFLAPGGIARAADSDWRDVPSEPGVSYKNERTRVPWSIHVLRIDRSRKDLAFVAAHARDKVLGVSMIAQQARAVSPAIGKAIGGVNGDFYVRDNPTYAGDPRGLQIMNGDLISGPDTVCVWFDADGNPHLDEVKGDFKVTWPDGKKTPFGLNQQRPSRMAVLYTPTYGPSTRAIGGRELVLEKAGDGPWLPLQAGQTYRARVREVQTNGNTRFSPDIMVLSLGPQLLAGLPELAPGLALEISTATTPDLKGVQTAIAGGPAIIQNGKPFALKEPPPGASRNYSEGSKYERHPRSAVGWSATHVYLVTVDGRQPGLSVGMKLAELAEYMAKLGCAEAMNLDGGKSAQMWMTGRIVNDPCQGEDTVANSLLVVRKAEGR